MTPHTPVEIRRREYAQSSLRVFDAAMSEAEARVRTGTATKAQAFAMVRRKYQSLRDSYFARENNYGCTLGDEQNWNEHGPKQAFDALYRRWFSAAELPPAGGR